MTAHITERCSEGLQWQPFSFFSSFLLLLIRKQAAAFAFVNHFQTGLLALSPLCADPSLHLCACKKRSEDAEMFCVSSEKSSHHNSIAVCWIVKSSSAGCMWSAKVSVCLSKGRMDCVSWSFYSRDCSYLLSVLEGSATVSGDNMAVSLGFWSITVPLKQWPSSIFYAFRRNWEESFSNVAAAHRITNPLIWQMSPDVFAQASRCIA